MSTPWFFLSYSSADSEEEKHVKEFYFHLVSAVRRGTAKIPDESVGFCAPEIALATVWPGDLAEKLASCRVLVCLYSKTYFDSPPCGKEFYIFRSRLNDYVKRYSRTQPPLIVPVLWVVEKNFDELLPEAAKPIHYKCPSFEIVRHAGGVLNLKEHSEKEYRKYVTDLAETIRKAANIRPPLDVLDSVPDFDNAGNAWIDLPTEPTRPDAGLSVPLMSTVEVAPPTPSDLSATAVSPYAVQLSWQDNSKGLAAIKIERGRKSGGEDFKDVEQIVSGNTEYNDRGLTPATTYIYRICASKGDVDSDYSNTVTVTTPRRWPIPLIVLMISAAVILTTIGFMLRCRFIPTLCSPSPTPSQSPTPSHPPTPALTKFVDLFQRTSSGPGKWGAADNWIVPDQWSRLGDSPLGGWLVVKGTEPGAVKNMGLGDLITRFRLEFVDEKGNKAGWQMHVRTEEKSVKGGYCFLLERNATAKDRLEFSAYDCQTKEEIHRKETTGITQYGRRERDVIQVEAISKNNEFKFFFRLRNSQEAESISNARGNIRQCYPIIVKGNPNQHVTGSVGLFAGDGDTEFKISRLEVYQLTEDNLKKVLCLNN